MQMEVPRTMSRLNNSAAERGKEKALSTAAFLGESALGETIVTGLLQAGHRHPDASTPRGVDPAAHDGAMPPPWGGGTGAAPRAAVRRFCFRPPSCDWPRAARPPGPPWRQ